MIKALKKIRYWYRMAKAIFLVETMRTKLNQVSYSMILGPGRTGTRTLGLLFKDLGSCFSRHEPRPSLLQLSVELQGNSKMTEKQYNMFLRYRALYLDESIKRRKVFIESNYALTFIAESLINRKFKVNAVFVTRNPVDYVRSAFSKEHNRGNDPHKIFDHRDTRTRINREFFKKFSDSEFQDLSRFEKICWNYRIYHEAGEHLVSKKVVPAFFRMEDIVTSRSVFGDFLKRLNLNLTDSEFEDCWQKISVKTNFSDTYLLGQYDDWSEPQKEQFNSIIKEPLSWLPY